MMKRALIMTSLLLLTSCASQAPQTGEHSYTSWAGKWQGVEGTYLVVTPQSPNRTSRHYKIEIRDLDGSRFFDGVDREHGIQFTRDGKPEQLHAGNGADTGMKWLADKRNCLVVHTGEGYCRN